MSIAPLPQAPAAEAPAPEPAKPAAEPAGSAAPRKGRRRWRVVRRAAMLTAVVLLACGVALYLNLDRMLKGAAEGQSARVLNLKVDSDTAHVAPFAGEVTLGGYRIASPAGFSQEPLVRVERGEMKLSLWQFHRKAVRSRDEPVRIESVTLRRPRLVVERVNGALNIKRMMDGIRPPPPKPLRLVIDRVTVEGAVVVLRPEMEGLQSEYVVDVPTFHVDGIGKAHDGGPDEGATVGQAITQLVVVLMVKAGNSPALPPDLQMMLKDPLGAALRSLGARAQRELRNVIPGDAGRALSGIFLPRPGPSATPPAGWPPTRPATSPATQPAPPAAPGLLRGIFGGGRRSG